MKNKKKIKNQKIQEILSQNNSVKENNSIEMNYSVRIVFTQLKNFNKTLFFLNKAHAERIKRTRKNSLSKNGKVGSRNGAREARGRPSW